MNLNLIDKPSRSKLGAFAGGALVIGCCVAGPLLIGAACVLAIGVVGELVAVGALLAALAIALWHIRARRRKGCQCATPS